MRLIPKNRWFRLALILCLIVFGPYLYSRAASSWNCVTHYQIEPTVALPENNSRDTFRVLTYNIAHGRGLAKSNLDGGDSQQRKHRLNAIAELLRKENADVVILNEVDFSAAWSHSVNQAKYLAKRAGYRYVAEQRNLDFRVLFWKLDFGNAILSKHKIQNAKVVDFPGYSSFETLVAGKKRAVCCNFDIHGTNVNVVAAHLSHRSEKLRVQSANMLINLLKNDSSPTIIAGDLNSTPSGFPHSGKDDQGRNAMDTLWNSNLIQAEPKTDPATKDLTFHAKEPKNVIDWILIPRNWSFNNYRVLESLLSDHRPVVADINISRRR